jgi:superfamily II DNA or RNA helicase
VTASPVRLSGESLAEHFDSLVVGPTYEELIHDGYLSPCKVYAPPTIDTQGLHSRAGDYVTAELEARTGKPHVTGDAIEHYIRHTPGKRAVLFDVSVQAARGRAQAFRDRGFPAACIDGSLEASHRRSLVADFRAGRLTILTSCELISEGFDLPAIEVGISLRPTQSLGLFLQQTGRILRPFPGKSVSVLFDHAGNVHRFGLPTETRSWTLSRSDPRVKRAVFRAGIRICPACFAASPARSMVCSECGAEFASSPRTVVERAGELKEITLSADQLAARRKRQEQGQARTLEALIHLGRRRRLKHPEAWARRLLAARQRSRRT